MKKEKSSAAWIMQWAGRQKSLYSVSVVLAVLNVLFKLIPFFIIGDVINKLLNGEKNFSVYLIEIAMIAASFVIAEIFHSISTAFHTKLLSAYSVRFVKKPATNFQECRSDMLKIHHRVRLRT